MADPTSAKSMQLIKHSETLRFTVVAEPHDCHVNYTIYDIEAWNEGSTPNVFDEPMWQRAGSTFGPDPVAALAEAEPYLHGEVKWDGCSNWHFDEQERGMLHGCRRSDVLRFGEVMALCWDWTAELCPDWDPVRND